jgi:hypothetical protein
MPLSLAEPSICIERSLCHFVIELNDDNSCLLHKLVEEINGLRTKASKENDPGFEGGYGRDK